MGDYFDDDDLINEYMQEEFEIPPEYDEEFLAAELTGVAANISNGDNNKQSEPMDVEPPQQQQGGEEQKEDENNVSVPTSVTIQPPSPKTDVYSFERYQGDWRTTEKPPSDISMAMGWKKHGGWESQLLMKTRTRKPSAPDAQLVELSNRQQVLNPKIKVTQSSSVRLKPIEGDASMSVTLGDGTRVYVKKSEPVPICKETKPNGNILGVSMAELLRRSDAIIRKAERQKMSRCPTVVVAENNSDDNDDMEVDTLDDNHEDAANEDKEASVKNVSMEEEPMKVMRFQETVSNKNDADSQLWVDKHAPSEFSHLLSDERTNREVLRAIRAWDPYVFRKEAPPRPAYLQKKLQESSPTKKSGEGKDSSSSEKTKDIRPDETNRVILLAGPPGVGKTTLAHIIARHAGYRPLEVNASDERSSAVLKDRVIRAMESSTLNLTKKNGTQDKLAGRPNCVILDEVDGADAKGAIGALVEIIRAEIPPKGSKGSKNKAYLRRPIIFICNHKYSPALRPLLPYARQFDVAPPAPNRLIARLRSVLAEENLSVVGGSSLLNQLMNGAGGDIRACLYALQFAAARAREVASKKDTGVKGAAPVVDISSSLKAALTGTGLKDERNDTSATITAVFRKKKEQSLGLAIRGSGKPNQVERILQLIESFGDDSKTLDCIFMNLMNVSYVDPTLDRCTLAHEWLSSTDLCRSKHFMPAAAAAIHLLCRVETKPKLTFSNRQMVDAKYQLEANENLAERFVEGLAPSARGGATKGTAAIETVPYSLWMLSAGDGSHSLTRGVSSMEILNKNEKVAFDGHVSTLRSLGLTYVARDDASFRPFNDSKPVAMRLEPQIDRLVQFQDLSVPPGCRRKKIPHVLKELLAHGAVIQGMREQDSKKAAQVSPDTSSEKTGHDKPMADENLQTSNDRQAHSYPVSKHNLSISADAPPAKRSKTAKASKNFLGVGAAKAKAARMARKAALVGFDKSKKLKVSHTGTNIPLSQVVRFKYQKGFTQAVRTPCTIEDIV